MFSNFIKKNRSTILVITALLTLFCILQFVNRDRTKSLLTTPECGQIYIFHSENRYAPMRLDSIADSQLYFRNYLFVFADAIPNKDQILQAEFDLDFMAIYEKEELDRLYQIDQLVRIYEP